MRAAAHIAVPSALAQVGPESYEQQQATGEQLKEEARQTWEKKFRETAADRGIADIVEAWVIRVTLGGNGTRPILAIKDPNGITYRSFTSSFDAAELQLKERLQAMIVHAPGDAAQALLEDASLSPQATAAAAAGHRISLPAAQRGASKTPHAQGSAKQQRQKHASSQSKKSASKRQHLEQEQQQQQLTSAQVQEPPAAGDGQAFGGFGLPGWNLGLLQAVGFPAAVARLPQHSGVAPAAGFPVGLNPGGTLGLPPLMVWPPQQMETTALAAFTGAAAGPDGVAGPGQAAAAAGGEAGNAIKAAAAAAGEAREEAADGEEGRAAVGYSRGGTSGHHRHISSSSPESRSQHYQQEEEEEEEGGQEHEEQEQLQEEGCADADGMYLNRLAEHLQEQQQRQQQQDGIQDMELAHREEGQGQQQDFVTGPRVGRDPRRLSPAGVSAAANLILSPATIAAAAAAGLDPRARAFASMDGSGSSIAQRQQQRQQQQQVHARSSLTLAGVQQVGSAGDGIRGRWLPASAAAAAAGMYTAAAAGGAAGNGSVDNERLAAGGLGASPRAAAAVAGAAGCSGAAAGHRLPRAAGVGASPAAAAPGGNGGGGVFSGTGLEGVFPAVGAGQQPPTPVTAAAVAAAAALAGFPCVLQSGLAPDVQQGLLRTLLSGIYNLVNQGYNAAAQQQQLGPRQEAYVSEEVREVAGRVAAIQGQQHSMEETVDGIAEKVGILQEQQQTMQLGVQEVVQKLGAMQGEKQSTVNALEEPGGKVTALQQQQEQQQLLQRDVIAMKEQVQQLVRYHQEQAQSVVNLVKMQTQLLQQQQQMAQALEQSQQEGSIQHKMGQQLEKMQEQMGTMQEQLKQLMPVQADAALTSAL